jgi:ubiquinone/menaquinone biosynthesis C-methylase UbiE
MSDAAPRNLAPCNLALGKPADAGDFILERRHRLVVRHAPSLGGVLLDFGCGNGAQTLHFAGDFDRIIGVDVEAPFLAEFAREIAARGLAHRIEALHYDGERIPLHDATVDAVVSCEVLEHVRDERAALAEIHRVLKPGGWVAMTVPNRWWIFETHGARLPLLPWNRVPFFSWLPTAIHDRWARARIYRRQDIVKLLRGAGFRVESSAYVTAPLDVLKWRGLRDYLRRTLFASDLSRVPFKATAILVVATRNSTEHS